VKTNKAHPEKGSETEFVMSDPDRDAIADFRKKQLEAEGMVFEEESADDKPEDDKPEDDKPTDEPKDGEPTDESKDDKPEDKEVEIKVDGVVEKVKQSQIDEAGGIRALQKERAANKRLQEAAIRLQDAERRLKEIEKREKELTARPKEEPPKEEKKAYTKQELAELVRTINYGEADQAAEALEKVLSQQQQAPQVSQQIDVDALEERIRRKIRGDEILKRFNAPAEEGGFGDLKDTRFAQIPTQLDGKTYLFPAPVAVARAEVDRLINDEGADPDSWETYEKAGKYARAQFGLEQSKKDPTEDKHDKKRKTTQNLRGASVQSSGQPDKELTHEEANQRALAEILEARG
jgi:hypothetical protein